MDDSPDKNTSACAGRAGPGFAGVSDLPDLTKPARAALPTGIRAGEITAWRCWTIERDYAQPANPPLLRSVYMGNLWEPGVPMFGDVSRKVACIYGPMWAGVHSFKNRDIALIYLETLRQGMFGGMVGYAFGQILIWGDVIEHKHGWRSEYAAVKSIDAIYDMGDAFLDRLREVYKC